jgi:PAS domain S-box-containing protein
MNVFLRNTLLALGVALLCTSVYFLLPHRSNELQLTDNERVWLKEHPVIRIAPNPNFIPLEYRSDQGLHSGYSAEVDSIIQRRLGITFSIVWYRSQAEIFRAMTNKEVDVFSALSVTPERKEFLLFTRPLIALQNVVVVRKEDQRITSMDSLLHARLSLVRASMSMEYLTDRYNDLSIDTVSTGLESLYEVSFARADAAIVNLVSASYQLQQHQLSNLKVAFNFGPVSPICIGVRKDLPVLYGILDKALASIPPEQRNEIAQRWLGMVIEMPWYERVPLKVVAAALLFVTMSVVIVIFLNRTLKRQVREKTNELQQELNEQIKMEAALRQSEEKFHALFAKSADANILFVDGKVIDCNDVALQLMQRSREEMVGKTTVEISPPFQPDGISSDVKSRQMRDVALNKGSHKFEWRFMRRDGAELWAEVVVTDVQVEGEHMLFTTWRDIENRKKAEEVLRKNEEEMRGVFRASPVGYFIVVNQIVVSINGRFEEISGYSEQEILGRNGRYLYCSDQDYEYVVREVQRKSAPREAHSLETRWRKKDGTIIDVLLSGVEIDRVDGVPQLMGAVLDITERKLLSRQLIESQKMESLGTLAGGIAHDFNNILNIVMGYTDIIRKREMSFEKVQRYCASIQQATDRAAGLVREILTFARRTEFESKPLQINEITAELAKMLGETFPKSIEVVLDLQEDVPPILGDRTHLHQALLNLAVNARDAMPSTGKLFLTTRTVSRDDLPQNAPHSDTGRFVCISVQDTGVGMTEKIRERIFEPFFTTKEYGKGTGLGLSVVYGIIQGMNGMIDVRSTPGEGTTFLLYFPAVEQQAEPDALPQAESVSGGSETLLVIEDEELLREVVVQTLEAQGYRVIAAPDGFAALNLFCMRHSEIDLVISDLGMPKMDGWECYREMKKIQPDVAVVIASGFLSPEERARMDESGVRCFVQKPYLPDTILKTVRAVLDRK